MKPHNGRSNSLLVLQHLFRSALQILIQTIMHKLQTAGNLKLCLLVRGENAAICTRGYITMSLCNAYPFQRPAFAIPTLSLSFGWPQRLPAMIYLAFGQKLSHLGRYWSLHTPSLLWVPTLWLKQHGWTFPWMTLSQMWSLPIRRFMCLVDKSSVTWFLFPGQETELLKSLKRCR